MTRPQNPRTEAEDRLRGFYESLIAEGGEAGIIAYAEHIGVQLSTYEDGASWWPVFLAHYSKGAQIDEERLARDRATFPPTARGAAEGDAGKKAP